MLVFLTALVATPVLGSVVLLAGLLGVRYRDESIYDKVPRLWAHLLLRAAGVRVVLHGNEHRRGSGYIYIANHVSWYDVVVLAAYLRGFKFVAKAELARIPIFGSASRMSGTIFLERENRKSAFASYQQAASRIQQGASIAVFAEGTRGMGYPLRPFKKGPFVLAIAAQAPVIPTLVYGTIAIQPKGRWGVRSGQVDVHFLEPVPTAGMTYADRNALAMTVRDRMAAALREHYGIESPAWDPRRGAA